MNRVTVLSMHICVVKVCIKLLSLSYKLRLNQLSFSLPAWPFGVATTS
jgi:hypothetical protein